tara:strand:- start:722 stop:1321 length:600 start_codon:yes stop_codon:yes gene_type:complete
MKIDIERKVNDIFRTPTDINEHIPTIINLAQECDHITEMGVRGIISTWGWLAGFPKNGLYSYDLHNPSKWGGDIQSVYDTAEAYDIPFKFIEGDVLKIDIEETDLLFIDTWHRYDQLKSELARHSDKAKKYICFHDTTTYEHHGEEMSSEGGEKWMENDLDKNKGLWDAITEFLDDNNDKWELFKRYKNNNGFTIIKRK